MESLPPMIRYSLPRLGRGRTTGSGGFDRRF